MVKCPYFANFPPNIPNISEVARMAAGTPGMVDTNGRRNRAPPV